MLESRPQQISQLESDRIQAPMTRLSKIADNERAIGGVLLSRNKVLGVFAGATVALMSGAAESGPDIISTASANAAAHIAGTPDALGSPVVCPYTPPPPNNQPYAGAWCSSEDSNLQVKECLGLETGTGIGQFSGPGIITSRQIGYRRGSRAVQVTEGLSRIEIWEGNAFLFTCAEVVKTVVEQRIVEYTGTGSRMSHKNNYKLVGNVNIVHGNDSTTFDGVQAAEEITSTSTTLELPTKLTKAAIKHRRWGVQDTIVSTPLIQKPYLNPDDPYVNVPGPMEPISVSHITWITPSQVQ